VPGAQAPLARHLLRARDLADARYAEPLDLESLARAAHISPRHFSRSFRRTFGETPHQYLLTEVCLEIGFTSVGSFTTTFRRRVGVSPTAYRRANSGPSPTDRIPLCFAMAWARPRQEGAFREDGAPRPG
jgi:AraC-like DNA-binding protein